MCSTFLPALEAPLHVHTFGIETFHECEWLRCWIQNILKISTSQCAREGKLGAHAASRDSCRPVPTTIKSNSDGVISRDINGLNARRKFRASIRQLQRAKAQAHRTYYHCSVCRSEMVNTSVLITEYVLLGLKSHTAHCAAHCAFPAVTYATVWAVLLLTSQQADDKAPTGGTFPHSRAQSAAQMILVNTFIILQ